MTDLKVLALDNGVALTPPMGFMVSKTRTFNDHLTSSLIHFQDLAEI